MSTNSPVLSSLPVLSSQADLDLLNQSLDVLLQGPISVHDLAKKVQLSPAELPSILQTLVAEGVLTGEIGVDLTVDGVLQFATDIEPLERARIQQYIDPRVAQRIDHFELNSVVGSTNDQLLQSRLAPGTAAISLAEMQIKGRGRRGNVWQAQPFRNICLSVGYKLAQWPQATPSFALAAAVAVSNVLDTVFAEAALGEDVAGPHVQIKWPNDLLVNGAKLGGILVEAVGNYGQDCLLVVGLGLNLHQTDDSAVAGSDYRWTSLDGLHVPYSRNQLVGQLIESLLDTFVLFEQHGFAPFVAHWQARSAFHNQRVRVVRGDRSFVGWQRGVDAQGALLVEGSDGQIQAIDDASVSVREIEDKRP